MDAETRRLRRSHRPGLAWLGSADSRARRRVVGVAGVVALAGVVASCQFGGKEVAQSLPTLVPLTTTTTEPPTTTTLPRSYTVEAGDTGFSIAAKFGVSLDALLTLNAISNGDHIEVGQKLILPPSTTPITTPTTVPPGGGSGSASPPNT